MHRHVPAVLAFAMVSLGAAASAAAQTAACDRACLQGMLDQYLAAVIKHDPNAAPLVPGFRQTENAINVRPGNGVWKTVTGLGKVQRRYVDPVSGQAAYYGIVEEGGSSAVVTVRVGVENRKLTEAEWYLARPGDPGLNGPAQPGRPPANLFNPDYLIANPPPQRIVPPAQRLPRETLIAIVNSYFDGITSHDGSVIIAHPGCSRIENGTLVTGRRGGGPAPGGSSAPGRGAGPGPQTAAGQQQAPTATAPAARGLPSNSQASAENDCTSGLANFNLSIVAARRFPVVDVDAGIVLATAVFIRRPGSPTPRNVFSEWFIIDEGRIRSIYTAMFYPPPQLPVPNWPPYDGNFPLPAGVVPTPAPPAAAPAARGPIFQAVPANVPSGRG